jgi:hypothetical protein
VTVVEAPPGPVGVPGVPEYYRTTTLRPSPSALLDPSGCITWLDADCWIQSASVVQNFVATARNRAIACAIELDRSHIFGSQSAAPQPIRRSTPALLRAGYVADWPKWNQLMIEFMTSLIGRLSPDLFCRQLQLLADQAASTPCCA